MESQISLYFVTLYFVFDGVLWESILNKKQSTKPKAQINDQNCRMDKRWRTHVRSTLAAIEENYLMLRSYEEVAEAIRKMVIRGAPAIGYRSRNGLALAQANP